jgi:hypothetical protein
VQYEVQIDLKKVQSGSLYDDWDMIPPRKIKDPKAVKPDVRIKPLIYVFLVHKCIHSSCIMLGTKAATHTQSRTVHENALHL